MHHRMLLLAAVVAAAPTLARADDSIAGQWRAQLPDNVTIAMDVLADGHWTSETVQGDKVVAEMAGTYTQTKSNATSGTLVWRPTKVKLSQGAPRIENDKYTLQQGGSILRLLNGTDVQVYKKQPSPQ